MHAWLWCRRGQRGQIVESYFNILGSVVPIYLLMVLGAGVRARKWLTREGDHTLMNLALNVLFPCLIFEKILGNPALEITQNLLIPPVIGFLATTVGFALAYATVRVAGITQDRCRRTFAMTVGVFNFGYIPIPLVMDFFGLETLGVLFVFNLGVDLAIWTVGVSLLSGQNPLKEWRRILSGPLIAIVLGLLTNFTVGRGVVPGVLITVLEMLGGSAIPIVLLLIGAVMYDYFKPGILTNALRVSSWACTLRLLVLPVLFLLTAKYFPMTEELRQVITVQAAMGAGVFPLVMTRHYHGDVSTAFCVIFSTSIVSLVTAPLWLHFGLWFIH